MRERPGLVVDASVVVKWVLPEADSPRAREILDRQADGDIELFSPETVVSETGNAIWKRCRLMGELDEDRARRAFDAVLTLLPDLTSSRPLAAQALELALTFRHPVYDCVYVALALQRGCPLVTADRRLVRALGPATGHVVHLDDWTAET